LKDSHDLIIDLIIDSTTVFFIFNGL
jgi:hypothetical protein